MKIITKDGKLFGKISVLDIIIIVAILFVAIVLILNVTNNLSLPMFSKTTVEYTAKFKAYSVEKGDRCPFEIGDKLYSNNDELIGIITNIEIKPLTVKSKLQNGTYFDYEMHDYDDYILTIEGSGTLSDTGFAAEGTFAMYPGNSVYISSKYFNGPSVVLSVEKKY